MSFRITLVLLMFILNNANANFVFVLNSCPDLSPTPFTNVIISQEDKEVSSCNVANDFSRIINDISVILPKYNEQVSLSLFYRTTYARYHDKGVLRFLKFL